MEHWKINPVACVVSPGPLLKSIILIILKIEKSLGLLLIYHYRMFYHEILKPFILLQLDMLLCCYGFNDIIIIIM